MEVSRQTQTGPHAAAAHCGFRGWPWRPSRMVHHVGFCHDGSARLASHVRIREQDGFVRGAAVLQEAFDSNECNVNHAVFERRGRMHLSPSTYLSLARCRGTSVAPRGEGRRGAAAMPASYRTPAMIYDERR